MTYFKEIYAAAKLAGVSGHLMIALCTHESGLKNVVVQDDGDGPTYGICQVKLETARHMDEVYNLNTKATIKRIMNPFINAFYSAKYLKFQLEQNNGDVLAALDSYNKGHLVSRNSKYVRYIKKTFKKLFPEENFETNSK